MAVCEMVSISKNGRCLAKALDGGSRGDLLRWNHSLDRHAARIKFRNIKFSCSTVKRPRWGPISQVGKVMILQIRRGTQYLHSIYTSLLFQTHRKNKPYNHKFPIHNLVPIQRTSQSQAKREQRSTSCRPWQPSRCECPASPWPCPSQRRRRRV